MSEIRIIPTADGDAKFITGGRTGLTYQIRTVTNLTDSKDTGSANYIGSLRWAVSSSNPTIVTFAVSGTITLIDELQPRSNTSILGFTSSGQGITIRNYRLYMIGKSNVFIQGIRVRLGSTVGNESQSLFVRDCENVLIDRCSFSWSTDENASLFRNKNVTFQYCIISEPLNNSVHSKGEHGYSSIFGGKDVCMHHCLVMHGTQRNIRFDNPNLYATQDQINNFRGRVDFKNNVIYNWRDVPSHGLEGGIALNAFANVQNNYYIAGPATETAVEDWFLRSQKSTTDGWAYGVFYVDGNILEGEIAVNIDNWLGVRLTNSSDSLSLAKSNTPYLTAYEGIESAGDAYTKVIAKAGVSFRRDSVDTRLISEVVDRTFTFTGSNGSTNGIIDSQADVGGWPSLSSTPTNATFADYLAAKSLPGGTLELDVASSGRLQIEEYNIWLLDEEPPIDPTPYTIDIVVNPSGSYGSAVKSPETPSYAQGAIVTFTATVASPTYTFVRWIDNRGTISTSNPYVFTVPDSNTIMYAEFRLTNTTGKKFRGRKQL